MIYKIDHYYYEGNDAHDALCLLIESNIEIVRLVEILASIEFKFEEFIGEEICADGEHILSILKEFYGVEDVKEQYKKYLPYTHLPDKEWEIINVFEFTNEDFKIIQIDLYEARESCCGKGKKIMEKVLPKDEKFESYIKSLKDFYVKRFGIK